jgi:hypothetical protein
MRIIQYNITVVRTNGRQAEWVASTKEVFAEIKNPLNKSILVERTDQEAKTMKKLDFEQNLEQLKNAAKK